MCVCVCVCEHLRVCVCVFVSRCRHICVYVRECVVCVCLGVYGSVSAVAGSLSFHPELNGLEPRCAVMVAAGCQLSITPSDRNSLHPK